MQMKRKKEGGSVKPLLPYLRAAVSERLDAAPTPVRAIREARAPHEAAFTALWRALRAGSRGGPGLGDRLMALPRMIRAIVVQPRMTRTSATVQMLRMPTTVRKTIAPSRNGSEKKMSVIREMIVSTQPPK